MGQTLALTAAALASAHCDSIGEQQLCAELSAELISRLGACDPSGGPACCLPPLRALTNLRHPAAVPTLIDTALADDTESECRAEALTALSALPPGLTGPLRPRLERLYGQPDRYDVTSRLLAADLLLASPRPSDAGLLLSRLTVHNASEEAAYALQRLRAAASGHPALAAALRRQLADPRLGNYDVLARGALSAVQQRTLWDGHGVATGFQSVLEAAQSRASRRSGFGASLEAAGRRLDVLSVRGRLDLAAGWVCLTPLGDGSSEADNL